jgi:hypothetical protein
MVLVPALTAVTSPVVLTAATALSEEDQTIAGPVMIASVESRSVAEACVVAPTAIDVASKLTLMESTEPSFTCRWR